MKTPGGDGGEILRRRPKPGTIDIDQYLLKMGFVKIEQPHHSPCWMEPLPVYRFPGPPPRRQWISRETMSVVVGASFGFWAAFYLTGLAGLLVNLAMWFLQG